VDMQCDRIHPEFSRGSAYVEYELPDDAEKAIKHMDGGQIDGQEVTAQAVLVPKPQPRPVRRSPPMRRAPPPGPRWGGGRGPSPPRFPPRRRRSIPPRRRTKSRSRTPKRRRYSRSSSSSS